MRSPAPAQCARWSSTRTASTRTSRSSRRRWAHLQVLSTGPRSCRDSLVPSGTSRPAGIGTSSLPSLDHSNPAHSTGNSAADRRRSSYFLWSGRRCVNSGDSGHMCAISGDSRHMDLNPRLSPWQGGGFRLRSLLRSGDVLFRPPSFHHVQPIVRGSRAVYHLSRVEPRQRVSGELQAPRQMACAGTARPRIPTTSLPISTTLVRAWRDRLRK